MASEGEWWSRRLRGVELRGTIHYPSGPGDAGRAVLALHGGPGVDGVGLRYLFRDFDAATVVVPDQRGHGRSDLASSQTWTLDDWADDAAALVDALGLHRPVVVGTSFGGWVALHLAARHPDRVGGLVIAAMTARLPTVEEGVARMVQLGGEDAGNAWRVIHDPQRSDELAQAQLVIDRLMASREAPPDLQELRDQRILTPEVNAFFTPRFQDTDLTEDAAAVRCPSGVVVGERDPLTTPALATETYDLLPGPRLIRLIPNASHELVQDAPEVLLDTVRWALRTASM